MILQYHNCLSTIIIYWSMKSVFRLQLKKRFPSWVSNCKTFIKFTWMLCILTVCFINKRESIYDNSMLQHSRKAYKIARRGGLFFLIRHIWTCSLFVDV